MKHWKDVLVGWLFVFLFILLASFVIIPYALIFSDWLIDAVPAFQNYRDLHNRISLYWALSLAGISAILFTAYLGVTLFRWIVKSFVFFRNLLFKKRVATLPDPPQPTDQESPQPLQSSKPETVSAVPVPKTKESKIKRLAIWLKNIPTNSTLHSVLGIILGITATVITMVFIANLCGINKENGWQLNLYYGICCRQDAPLESILADLAVLGLGIPLLCIYVTFFCIFIDLMMKGFVKLITCIIKITAKKPTNQP